MPERRERKKEREGERERRGEGGRENRIVGLIIEKVKIPYMF